SNACREVAMHQHCACRGTIHAPSRRLVLAGLAAAAIAPLRSYSRCRPRSIPNHRKTARKRHRDFTFASLGHDANLNEMERPTLYGRGAQFPVRLRETGSRGGSLNGEWYRPGDRPPSALGSNVLAPRDAAGNVLAIPRALGA